MQDKYIEKGAILLQDKNQAHESEPPQRGNMSDHTSSSNRQSAAAGYGTTPMSYQEEDEIT
jgi:hypothetical protein